MSARADLIVNALETQLEIVRARLVNLNPDQFGDAGPYVAQLRQSIAEWSPGDLAIPDVTDKWMEAGEDCLEALRSLSLGGQLSTSEAQAPAVSTPDFLQSMAACRSDPQRRVELLTKRYACPLNFNAAGEQDIREHLLTRLMVHDRSTIERESIEAVDALDLLLKLNLIAIHAPVTSDLRFLDALNYYYELLPADWVPRARHAWLAASFPGFYARALAGQILRHQIIAHSDTREHTARGPAHL
jgi:hypothetical protein